MRVWLLGIAFLLTLSLGQVTAQSTNPQSNITASTSPLHLAEMTGVWSGEWSATLQVDYYFDGHTMTLLTRADATRGPGTEILRVSGGNDSPLQAEWLNSRQQWMRLNASLENETLTLSSGGSTWSISRISSETHDEVTARYPGVQIAAPATQVTVDEEENSNSLTGMDANVATSPASLAEMTGIWSGEWSMGISVDYYFDGRTMIALSKVDARFGPGTEMLRVRVGDNTTLQAEWFSHRRTWVPVGAALTGETLTLTSSSSWSISRVSSETAMAVQARYPNIVIPGAVAQQETLAFAAITSDAMRDLHPSIFDALATVRPQDELSAEAVTKAAEIFLVIAAKIDFSDLTQSLGLATDDFIAAITNDPDRFTKIFAEDIGEIGSAVFISLVADFSARVATDAVFSTEPYASLPDAWKVPLDATLHATLKEAMGIIAVGSNPTPLSLISPVVNRINDLRDIAEESRGLAETQTKGLYSVALGAELLATLATDYPGTQTDMAASLWWRDTTAALPGMVGPDDAAAVLHVAETGYQALLAQQRGDENAARQLIAEMEAIPTVADGGGLFALSAEGPVDLLAKMASGFQDAPLVLASAFVSATTLETLVEGETLLRTLEVPGATYAKAPADRALAAIRQLPSRGVTEECGAIRGPLVPEQIRSLILRHQIELQDSRDRALHAILQDSNLGNYSDGWKVYVPGGPTATYRVYLCEGMDAAFVFTRGTTPETDSRAMHVVDVQPVPRAPMGVGQISWESIISGAPMPLSNRPGCQVRARALVNTTKVEWSGVCADGFPVGEGVFDWWGANGQLDWRTHVGANVWTRTADGKVFLEMRREDVTLEIESCRDRTDATVLAEFPADFPIHGFTSGGLYSLVRDAATTFAQEHCPDRTFGGVALIRAGEAEPDIRSRDTWERSQFFSRMRSASQQIGRDRIAMERQAEIERQANLINQAYEAEIAAYTQTATRFLDEGTATLSSLAMALDLDEFATLDRLERGIKLVLNPPEGVETIQVEGERAYLTRYQAVSPAWVAKRQMNQQMAQLGWSGWFALTADPTPRRIVVSCTYERLGRIPRETGQVSAELVSFTAGGGGIQIGLACR